MIGQRLAQVARRQANKTSDRFASIPKHQFVGDVVSVAGSVVKVRWRGGEVEAAAKNRDVTFAAGDRVVCDVIDDQVIAAYVTG